MLEIEEEIIWEQGLESNYTAFSLGFQSIFYAFILLVSVFGIAINIYFLASNNVGNFDFLNFIAAIVFFFGAIYQIVFTTKISIIEYSLKQSITKNYIQYTYGLFFKRKIKIPFEKIANITLVGSRSTDFYTIYFNPTEKLKHVSYNFKKGKKRHCPTFEMVIGGKAVYQLLMDIKEHKN